jgi:hypothetical protein
MAARRLPGPAKSKSSKTPRGAAARRLLSSFLARFEPQVARLARKALARARALTPPTYELVYDAYNALSVGFCFSERTGEHFLHVAVYPRHVNLGFPFGTSLTDPQRRLLGSGARVRHLSVRTASDLRDPELAHFVREAAGQALARATSAPPSRRELLVKAIYAQQRPRRPPH